MLKKLVCYEFKALEKLNVFLLALLLGFSLITSVGTKLIVMFFGDAGLLMLSIAETFIQKIYITITVGVFSVMFVNVILRFRKGVLGSEGYYINSLPIFPGDVILSHVITSVTWVLLAICVSVASDWLIFDFADKMFGKMFFPTVSYFVKSGMDSFSMFLMKSIYIIVVLSELFLTIYMSMMVGFSFEKGKEIMSCVIFSLFKFAEGLFILLIIDAFEKSSVCVQTAIHIVFYGLFAIVYYFIARYFLENELNLE